MTFYSNPKRDYVLNPRGKALYDDANRFGTKMLEKMGWSKGKGLGANLDGQLEFIKVSHKGDQKGVGFKDRDDQWTTHESNFNSLLSSFKSADNSDDESQDCAVQPFQSDDKSAKSKKENVSEKDGLFSGVSLEERSKNSRARVHYKKFTRGKDLARYSEKDLANIFGKKSLQPNAEPDGSTGESNEDEKLDKSSDYTPNFGITTIATGTTINDYFKNKMRNVTNGVKAPTDERVSNGPTDEQVNNVECASISKKEKKSRKKSKDLESALQDCNLETSKAVADHSEQSSHNESKKRNFDEGDIEESKSSKKKRKKSTGNLVVETPEEEAMPSSKKSKKHKSEDIHENSTNANGEGTQAEKSRKSKSEVSPIEDCETVNNISGKESNLSKKSKNKNRNDDVNESQSSRKDKSEIENNASSLDNGAAPKHKKSKKKRERKQSEDANDSPTLPVEQKSSNFFEVLANAADQPNLTDVVTDNVYEIRRYRTEIFRYVDLQAFPGSTLCDIPGYGYTSEMTLKIVDKADDSKLINTLWNDAQDKYAKGNDKKKKKKFVEHIGALKKKNVFKI